MRRIVFAHYDVFVLAGNLRAILMLADMTKYLGYKVLFLYTNIRPREAWYWSPSQLRDYHPVKYLEMCEAPLGRPCGDFQLEPWQYLHIRLYDWMIYDNWDMYVEDEPKLLWLAGCCPAMRGIHYTHYPDRPKAPRQFREYVFNSSYTADLAAYWWGVKGWILWPPLWTDMYKSRDYNDRDIDVIFFGQMYRVKGFNIAEKLLEKGYTVAVVGAWVGDWKPNNDSLIVRRNATFDEYAELLSRSRVYVHARPGEHFGITITEAMASGCPAIVHKTGGQWSDIAVYGRYAMGWSRIEELMAKIDILTRNRYVWEDWHMRALERAKVFDVRRLATKWRQILETAIRRREEAVRQLERLGRSSLYGRVRHKGC